MGGGGKFILVTVLKKVTKNKKIPSHSSLCVPSYLHRSFFFFFSPPSSVVSRFISLSRRSPHYQIPNLINMTHHRTSNMGNWYFWPKHNGVARQNPVGPSLNYINFPIVVRPFISLISGWTYNSRIYTSPKHSFFRPVLVGSIINPKKKIYKYSNNARNRSNGICKSLVM